MSNIQMNLFQENKHEWIRKARDIARSLVLEYGEVTADDIHDAIPIPSWIDGRCMGAVFHGMRCIRYQKSKRKVNHHRPIGVFTI